MLAEGDGEASVFVVGGGGAADDAADADELVVKAAGVEVFIGGILGGRWRAVGEDFNLGGVDAGEVEAFEGGAADADEVADEKVRDTGLGAEEGAGFGVLDEDGGGVGDVGDASLEVDGEFLFGLVERKGTDCGGGSERCLSEGGAGERQDEEKVDERRRHYGLWTADCGALAILRGGRGRSRSGLRRGAR